MPEASNIHPRARRKSTRRKNLTLIALRINAGMSRVDLERRSGVSRETIRLAELGYVPLNPRIQADIAKELGAKPLDIWPIETQRVAA